MAADMTVRLSELLETRFGEDFSQAIPEDLEGEIPEQWMQLAQRGSCRRFSDKKVSDRLIETLCALSLCAPTKSDLQQRDIIIIDDESLREKLNALVSKGHLSQPWMAKCPHLLIFCGNNRRQRLVHEWRQKEFVNDHLDAFFNTAVDAAIAMSNFVVAAEAAGLGCCPISAIRNEAEEVSRLLSLPDYVFPVVGLGLGWPDEEPKINLRQPARVAIHKNTYAEENLREVIEAYDTRRNAAQPYGSQRYVDDFGHMENYGWSEDKARQYAKPEREKFGAFIKAKKFKLE